MDCSFNRSYLTESTNSLLTKYFVVDKQLCGDVSYEIFENRICGYAIRFSNVDQSKCQQIRPEFDRLIAACESIECLTQRDSARSRHDAHAGDDSAQCSESPSEYGG